MKEEKKTFSQVAKNLNVKNIIECARKKGIIKPHTEAFKEVPTNQEKHSGKVNYFTR